MDMWIVSIFLLVQAVLLQTFVHKVWKPVFILLSVYLEKKAGGLF